MKFNSKKLLLILLLLAVFSIICITVIIYSVNSADKSFTFIVNIPKNTPAEDDVYLFIDANHNYKMSKTVDYKYLYKVAKEDLVDIDLNNIHYRYTRNGGDFNTAEYLEPDTNDYFWTQRGRTTNFISGKIHEDTISRWRWFPDDNHEIISITNLKPDANFQPRIGNIEFQSGQVIEDLYIKAYDNYFESTAKHLVDIGYRWVEIAPPWQWSEENGLPKVINDYEHSPNYPNDAKFLEEVKAYKNAGLKVRVSPQICCTELSTDNRSEEWWNAYFSETIKFLVHFATLSESAKVDAFQYAIGSWDVQRINDWPKVFTEIKKVFSGEIGEMLWNFGGDPGKIIPTQDEILWGDILNYFYVSIDAPLSYKDNPTDQELKNGADIMLDGIKPLYEKYKKPIIIHTTYFNIQQTWKGNSYYSIGDPPWEGSSEQDSIIGKYKFSNTDQTRVIQAYFTSIAERPWIVGYEQFGYGHWVRPLAPDLSIRGKPSEDLWRKWNNLIYSLVQ